MDEAMLARFETMLGRLDTRLEAMNTTISDINSRTVGMESWRTSHSEETRRFWDQAWPAQAEIVRSIEERVRSVERDRITMERLKEMDSKFSSSEKSLELRLAEVEKSTVASKIYFTISAAAVSMIATGLMHVLLKHFA